ncbi:MAG: hypothetical protein ACOCQD_02180 [archaeon]
MLIIFEGMDRTGKDTQIENLSNHLGGAEVIHFGLPPEGTMESQFEFFVKQFSYANKNRDKYIIWNRSHLGEAVYGYLYRDWYYEYIFELEKVYKDLLKDSALILCDAEVDNVLSRDDGKSLSDKKDNKEKERRRFQAVVDFSTIPNKFVLNASSYSIEELTEQMTNFIEGVKT